MKPPGIRALWDWRGTTSRTAYVGWGLGLMVLKYNLDRLVAIGLGLRRSWDWTNYWRPFDSPIAQLSDRDQWLGLVLLALAIPFIAAGVILTMRRLRDAGWPLWLTILFFPPILNLVAFALLAVAPPSRVRPATPPATPDRWWARMAGALGLHNPVVSAVFAIFLSAALAVPLTALATVFFKSYGWGVFVALPFCLGMFAALFHGAAAARSLGSCIGVAMLALGICGAAVLAVAIEGLLCLLMAAPIAAPIVAIGAVTGYSLQIAGWGRAHGTGRLYAVAWVALPLALGTEVLFQPESRQTSVTTSVDIAAPSGAVWRNVVTFSELPPPHEWVFKTGIAYPVRATIEGHGVGAIRYCEFSTGPFVEPITVWDEGSRLAFDVIEQPHPMRELSPYRDLEPAHLDGFFRSRRGEFRLIPLPGGHTRLEGTTWYTQELWPAPYWRAWSDYLVHRIHGRVLEHIKASAEQETQANDSFGTANARESTRIAE